MSTFSRFAAATEPCSSDSNSTASTTGQPDLPDASPKSILAKSNHQNHSNCSPISLSIPRQPQNVSLKLQVDSEEIEKAAELAKQLGIPSDLLIPDPNRDNFNKSDFSSRKDSFTILARVQLLADYFHRRFFCTRRPNENPSKHNTIQIIKMQNQCYQSQQNLYQKVTNKIGLSSTQE